MDQEEKREIIIICVYSEEKEMSLSTREHKGNSLACFLFVRVRRIAICIGLKLYDDDQG